MEIKGHLVKGAVIDEETRCTHYHTERDRIAIKFYCCQTYYPCYLCHEEAGCEKAKAWPLEEFHQKAILCGACGKEITISAYLRDGEECPYCHAAFNPNCSLHQHFYFKT